MNIGHIQAERAEAITKAMNTGTPDNVENMNRERKYTDPHLADSYQRGWNYGHGIACHNVPTLGDKVFTDASGRQTVTADNIRDIHAEFCYQAESNGRDFSPFEFTAHHLNEYGEGSEDMPSADEMWSAFDEGIADAINADLATYTDEDYGIEED